MAVRVLFVLAALALIASPVLARPAFTRAAPSGAAVPLTGVALRKPPPEDQCQKCMSWYAESVDTLAQLMLDKIINGCGELCGLLANATGKTRMGEICDLICDITGFNVFTNYLSKADFDSFYFCELVEETSGPGCQVNDHGDASVTAIAALPPSGPVGTTFEFNVTYVSRNGTGSGTIVVFIVTPDGVPVGGTFYSPFSPAGTYQDSFSIKAEWDPSCQQNCEMWLPGPYVFQFTLCNGECGSQKPHSQLYAFAQTNFTIV